MGKTQLRMRQSGHCMSHTYRTLLSNNRLGSCQKRSAKVVLALAASLALLSCFIAVQVLAQAARDPFDHIHIGEETVMAFFNICPDRSSTIQLRKWDVLRR